MSDDRLVWIDCEMTGLELGRDALIEIAVVVTDAELRPLDDGLDIVIHTADDVLETMVPFVKEMHDSSGLTEAVRQSKITLGEAGSSAVAQQQPGEGLRRRILRALADHDSYCSTPVYRRLEPIGRRRRDESTGNQAQLTGTGWP